MENLPSALAFIVTHHQEILMAVMSLLTGIIAIAMLIPGEQPEKTLQKIVDFISKFSKK